jgi:diguanylate cyclase (GGDEF)-like protein/PAS domain S-box-containing protein
MPKFLQGTASLIAQDMEEFFSKQTSEQRYFYALSLIYQRYKPKHCFIARLKPETNLAKMLCHLHLGVISENLSYPLLNTPCSHTLAKTNDKTICLIDDVPQSFPDDNSLQNWACKSYLGIPLTSFDQQPVGLLVCLFEQSKVPTDINNSWLTQLAKAIGSEINHQIKNKAYSHLLNQLEIGEKLAKTGTWRWNLTTNELFCSKQVYHILSEPLSKQLNFNTIMALIHPEDIAEVKSKLAHLRHGEINKYDIIHRIIVDKQTKYVHVIGELENDDENYRWLNASVQDISATVELEQQLTLSNIVFNHASDAIMITDDHNKIISVNNALEKITGFSKQELIGKDPEVFASGKHNKAFYIAMWRKLKKTGQWKGEIFNKRKNGEIYPEELSMNVVKNSQGEITNYIAIFRDISEWKSTQEKLKFYANNEPLTGLSNRRHFIEHIEQQISLAHRHNETFTVMLINIDRFKEINSVHSQSIGDEVLKIIANRLKNIIRNEDSICRYSGDEFAILLPNTSILGAETVSQKIQDELTRHITIDKCQIEITISIGIAQYPLSGLEVATLLKNCTYAMQYVKSNGGNAIAFHDDSLQKQYLRKLVLREQLKKAIQNKTLRVYYQPIVTLPNKKVTKFEALVRWQNKNGEFISPAEFIPIAEEFGLIHLVGQFVLEQACNDLKKLYELGFTEISFSINRSICEFSQNSNEHNSIEQTILNAGIPLSAIVIEVTESVAMSSSKHTDQILKSLKQKGVKIALDDFCTGYSSLSYLVQYNADFIKIDKSFIDTIETDHNSQILISTLIELASKLQMKVIAEGVETEAQLALLLAMGCHFIQGYIFSPAVPFTNALTLLEHHSTMST